MDLTIETAAMTSYTTFIGPRKYKIPFLFNIKNMDPKLMGTGFATVSFNTICPLKGKVKWIIHGGAQEVQYTCDIDAGTITYSPGVTQTIPGVAGHPISMNGVTNLDIFQYFAPANIEGNNFVNQVNADALKQFAQRMQAHRSDPAYFQTAQGKADAKKMQALQQQLGNKAPQSFSQASKAKPGSAGAAKNASEAKILPGQARLRVWGTFNPKSNSAFDGSINGDIGPVHAKMSVKVEKLD